MKFIKFKSLSLFIVLLFAAQAKSQSITDTTMIVNGVCGMCKMTIELALSDMDGLKKASWDVESKVLTLKYNSEKLSLEAINTEVNKAGYDTEYSTANETAYQGLNPCCKYRDPKVIEDHQ